MAQQDRIGKRNTTISTTDGVTRVTYHRTVVVEVTVMGSVILRSGGWKTATTKTRMNQASNQMDLGYSVFQKNYAWYVKLPSGKIVDFRDGMIFDAPVF